MKNRYWPYLLIAILSIVCSDLCAQGDVNQGERLRWELERTDELIERAAEVLQMTNSPNPLAEQALLRAKQIQQKARESFNGKHFLMAWSLTQKAREAAGSAISICKQIERFEGVVLRRLERVGELLERIRDGLAEQQDQTLRVFFDNARDNQSRAWEFYRNQEYRPALKLIDQVEKAAERLSGMIRLNDRMEAEFHRRQENVELLMEQARETISGCGSEIAQRHLEQAEEAIRMGRDLHDRRQMAAALKALQRARQMAQKAIQECQGFGRLEKRYERLVNNANRLAEQVREKGGAKEEVSFGLIRQAREQLDMARSCIDGQDAEKALASLQAAQLALRQAERHMQGSIQ